MLLDETLVNYASPRDYNMWKNIWFYEAWEVKNEDYKRPGAMQLYELKNKIKGIAEELNYFPFNNWRQLSEPHAAYPDNTGIERIFMKKSDGNLIHCTIVFIQSASDIYIPDKFER